MVSPENRFAVFIDIDGTLFDENDRIPELNKKAIAAAREQGHAIFINTGRSLAHVPAYIEEETEIDGIVCGDGTLIKYHGEILYSSFFDRQLYMEIADYLLKNEEGWMAFEGVKRCYMTAGGYYPTDYQPAITSAEQLDEVSKDDSFQVAGLLKLDVEKILDRFGDRICVYEFGSFYDVSQPGCNKADCMMKVCELLGIRSENTIAIGDSENDLGMITKAGIGVAMSNSMKSVLEKADYISSSNNEGGVGKAIYELLLKEDSYE